MRVNASFGSISSLTFPYLSLAGGDGRLFPGLDIELETPTGALAQTRAILDTGADKSCFPLEIADVLGIELGDCEREQSMTVGGMALYYKFGEPLIARFHGFEFQLEATFMPALEAPLLGRRDFFSRFGFELNERESSFSVTPLPEIIA